MMVHDETVAMVPGVETAVTSRAWSEWVSTERHRARARTFLESAGVADLPECAWVEDAPEVHQLKAYCARVFPDMPTAMSAENADVADQCICLIGVLFTRFADARWVPYEWFGRDRSFYDDINPMLKYPFTEEGDTAWFLMDFLVTHGFSTIAGLVREYEERRDFDV